MFHCISQSSIPDVQFARTITDNMLFVETAFNQDENLLHNIFSGIYFRKPPDENFLTFTQEWPISGVKQQISFTIPYSFVQSNHINGYGDVSIHYRYQIYSKEHWAVVTPRFSLILPTGKTRKNLGFGVFGFQFNVPASKRLSHYFIVHLNAGFTLLPNAHNVISSGDEIKRTLLWFNVAGCIVWLATPNLNFMIEAVDNYYTKIGITGKTIRSAEVIISPAMQYAINLHDLRIVPGVGAPISISKSEWSLGFLGHLSFEFPF